MARRPWFNKRTHIKIQRKTFISERISLLLTNNRNCDKYKLFWNCADNKGYLPSRLEKKRKTVSVTWLARLKPTNGPGQVWCNRRNSANRKSAQEKKQNMWIQKKEQNIWISNSYVAPFLLRTLLVRKCQHCGNIHHVSQVQVLLCIQQGNTRMVGPHSIHFRLCSFCFCKIGVLFELWIKILIFICDGLCSLDIC